MRLHGLLKVSRLNRRFSSRAASRFSSFLTSAGRLPLLWIPPLNVHRALPVSETFDPFPFSASSTLGGVAGGHHPQRLSCCSAQKPRQGRARERCAANIGRRRWNLKARMRIAHMPRRSTSLTFESFAKRSRAHREAPPPLAHAGNCAGPVERAGTTGQPVSNGGPGEARSGNGWTVNVEIPPRPLGGNRRTQSTAARVSQRRCTSVAQVYGLPEGRRVGGEPEGDPQQ